MIRLLPSLTLLICYTSSFSLAHNAEYIALSNHMAKKTQLDIVANNAANSNSLGYEHDNLLFSIAKHKESKKKEDSFVKVSASYRSQDMGPIRHTGRNLDFAIIGPGYYKVLTPRGPRFTLVGSGFVNNQRMLVTPQGYAYASIDSQPIILPEGYNILDINSIGTVYADLEEIAQIGVFAMPDKAILIREGGGLYRLQGSEVAMEQYTILSGALRESNVDPTKIMIDLVELQRSSEGARNLVTELANLESTAIMKSTK